MLGLLHCCDSGNANARHDRKMLGTVCWLMLLALGLLIELFSRLGRTATPSLIRTGALVARSVVGRLFLLVFWIFVGLHLFARYTLPGH